MFISVPPEIVVPKLFFARTAQFKHGNKKLIEYFKKNLAK